MKTLKALKITSIIQVIYCAYCLISTLFIIIGTTIGPIVLANTIFSAFKMTDIRASSCKLHAMYAKKHRPDQKTRTVFKANQPN